MKLKAEDVRIANQIMYLGQWYMEQAKAAGKLREALQVIRLEQQRCLIQDPALIVKFNTEHAL